MGQTRSRWRSSRRPLDRLDQAAVRERALRFRETTMAERLETSLELGDLARELRAGMLKAR